ncbi:MAG: hypothetical protein LBQ73_07490 [Tannerellaceae bacterium]|jgi:hypothetical protein|nr:hypothetical protein [Tannerellaceae bacterium]
MKRSTLIFTVLLSTLFVAPFIVAAYYYFIPSVDKYYRILQIDNPSLSARDVIVGTERVDNETIHSFGKKEYRTLYYKGKKTFLPTVWDKEDTLYVGKPVEPVNDSPLTLHIPAGRLEKIYLNGEEIWSLGVFIKK